MAAIADIIAREVLDSRGNPTVEAEVVLDTDPGGRRDAFNPVELLLSALAACMLKGIERVTPMLNFRIDGAEKASGDATWELPWGERRFVRDHHNELLVRFRQHESRGGQK